MNYAVQFNSNGAFETSIKENPRLNYHKFRLELISYASSQCNEITGPTGFLLAWTDILGSTMGSYSRQFSGKRSRKYSDRGNFRYHNCNRGTAANAAVKIFEQLRRGDRNTIKRALQSSAKNSIHSFNVNE